MEEWQFKALEECFKGVNRHLEEQTRLLRGSTYLQKEGNETLKKILHELQEAAPEQESYLPSSGISIIPVLTEGFHVKA